MKTKLTLLFIFAAYIAGSQEFHRRASKSSSEGENFQFTHETTDLEKRKELMDSKQWIVEFTEEPLFQARKRNPRFSRDSFDQAQRFTRFLNDLLQIYQHSPYASTVEAPKIIRQYYRLYYGVAASFPGILKSKLEQLPYVKKIHKDLEVRTCLNESISQIKADQVWEQLDVTGEGMIVGIIDTGIDYLHESLGGGYGPGYKVINGYDFFNDDDDPMDDFGHGTHVAGIVASDHEDYRGVAPDALLYGVKALGANGGGSLSDIITSIEWCVDPDGDEQTDDKADVINMSLSAGAGNAQDPISQAANNAVDEGVIVCAAAGNRGKYESIGSPAAARDVITIGATKDNTSIAYFSSKGPVRFQYFIKPEVVAPGVNINSTYLNNTFQPFSGTSMASPHVAGVCALIKQEDSELTPQAVKSLLMNNAGDMRERVMAQGAGFVDALKAVEQKVICIPGKLDFGRNDYKPGLWQEDSELTIVNRGNDLQEVTFSVEHELPQGVTIDIEPQSLSLEGLDTAIVQCDITVDNDMLEFPQHADYSVAGFLVAETSSESMELPWSFTTKNRTYMRFDKTNCDAIGGSPDHTPGYFDYAWLNSKELFVDIIPGNYSYLFYHYHAKAQDQKGTQRVVLKSNLNLMELDTLEMNMNQEAKYSVDYNAVDHNGTPLVDYASFFTYSAIHNIRFPEGVPIGYVSKSLGQGMLLMNNIDPGFEMITAENAIDVEQAEKRTFVVNHGKITSLTQDTVLTNSPDDYNKQPFKMLFSPRHDEEYFSLGLMQRYNLTEYTISHSGDYLMTPVVNEAATATLHFIGNKLGEDGYSGSLFGNISTLEFPYFYVMYWLRSAPLYHSEGQNLMSWDQKTIELATFNEKDTVSIGNGPVIINGTLNYNREKSELTPLMRWYGPYLEDRWQDRFYTMVEVNDQQGNVVFSDTLMEDPVISLPTGKYNISYTQDNYFIDQEDGFGKATMLQRTDLEKKDYIPPVVSSLRIVNEDGHTNPILKHNENAEIVFSAGDFAVREFFGMSSYSFTYQGILKDSTQLFVRPSGMNSWDELDVQEIGENNFRGVVYQADISEYTNYEEMEFDVRICGVDSLNNSFDYKLEPAFKVSDLTTPTSESPYNQLDYSVKAHPNPFSEQVTFKFNTSIPEDSKITIYNISGSKVIDITNPASANTFLWNGVNNRGQTVEAGVYYYVVNNDSSIGHGRLLFIP